MRRHIDMRTNQMTVLACVAALLSIALWAGSVCAASSVTVTARHGDSVRGEIDGVTFFVLRGTSQEQGEAHGALGAKDILTVLDGTLIAQVEKQPGAWEHGILPMVRTFQFPEPYAVELEAMLDGIRKALPDSADRVLSSIGREITLDDLRALNCVGDIMSSGSNMASQGCSSFSAWGRFTADGSVIAGRNLDYTTFPGKIPFCIIARESTGPGSAATLDLSAPGALGVSTAMNSEGVVLLFHDESGLPIKPSGGYAPRPIVSRAALEHLTVEMSSESIVKLFQEKNVLTGTNTHLVFPSSGPGPRAAVVEWDGNPDGKGAAIRTPDGSVDDEALLCTNHYLARTTREPSDGGTFRRFSSLARAIVDAKAAEATIGLPEAKEMMDDVAVGGGGVTYLTAIAYPDERRFVFATTPDTGVPATKGKWSEVNWEQIFNAR